MAHFKHFSTEILSFLKTYVSDTILDVLRNKERKWLKEVFEFDKKYTIELFKKCFNSKEYFHCKLIHEYYLFLNRKKEDTKEFKEIFAKFTNKTFEISLILNWSYYKRKEDYHFVRKNYEEMKIKEMGAFFHKYTLKDYSKLIDIIEDLNLQEPHTQWTHSFNWALTGLLEKNPDLCLDVLEKIFATGNKIRLISSNLVKELNKSEKNSRILKMHIENHTFLNKQDWQLDYYHFLPQSNINKKTVQELLLSYSKLEENRWLDFNFIESYKLVQNDILIKIIEILLEKTYNSTFKWWSYNFFEHHYEEFNNNIEIVEKLYLYFQANDGTHFDHSGKFLKAILELDNDFIIPFLTMAHKKKHYISIHDIHINFNFIWELNNFKPILLKVFNLFEKKKLLSIDNRHFLNIFFPKDSENSKVAKFIEEFIKRNHGNKLRMKLIFNVISSSYPDRRIEYLFLLFEIIKDIKFVKDLNLTHRTGAVLVNARSSIYQDDKLFWEKLGQACHSNPNFLEIKIWAGEQQKYCDLGIEDERKRDFLSDD